jgi:hypothetical protein
VMQQVTINLIKVREAIFLVSQYMYTITL